MTVTVNNSVEKSRLSVNLNSLKAISPDKEFIDELVEVLNLHYECKTTSPKMWSEEKNSFYQYMTLSKGGPENLPSDKPKTCGQCDYFKGFYCNLLANYDERRDANTEACDKAIPKQQRRKWYW